MALGGSHGTCANNIANALAALSAEDKENLPYVWQIILGELFPHLIATIQVNAGQGVTTPDTINGSTITPGTIS